MERIIKLPYKEQGGRQRLFIYFLIFQICCMQLLRSFIMLVGIMYFHEGVIEMYISQLACPWTLFSWNKYEHFMGW